MTLWGCQGNPPGYSSSIFGVDAGWMRSVRGEAQLSRVYPLAGQSTAVKRKIKADLYTIQRNPTSSPHWLFQVKEKHRTPGNWSVYVTWGWKRSGYEWLTHSLHVCGLNTCCVHPLHVCGLNTCCVHSLHVCGLNTCCVPKRKHQNI